MTCHEAVAPQWRGRLAESGIRPLSTLLDEAADVTRWPGRWERLSKPGLSGRQRWRWEPDAVDGAVVYIKRYFATPAPEQWDRIRRQCRQHSRAYWEYAQAERLAQEQIRVPRAVGYVEEMRGMLERRSAVLLEQVPGDGLDRVWRCLSAQRAPLTRGAARHELVVRLARFVAAFHRTGTCHRDLYLCHIFVELDARGATPPRFTLIDLARAHRPRWRRTRWIVKDLAQLDASAREVGATRGDRWRFLLAYLDLPHGAHRARSFARRIRRKSDRIFRRMERQSRQ